MNEDKKKRISIRHILALIIGITGLCVLLYPTVADFAYSNQTSSLKFEFIEKTQNRQTDDDGPKPFEELYQYLRTENERLFETGQSGLVDAFSYQRAGIGLSDYGIEDGCIGFINIPSIGIEMPIYLGANTENMRKGAVHLTQTSYPIGGENTNCVIAAHRGSTTEMFRNIHKIEIGDEIIITNFREQLVYRVVETKIILPTDINEIKIQEGRELVTLISCNPLGANYQRYVVYCERVY